MENHRKCWLYGEGVACREAKVGVWMGGMKSIGVRKGWVKWVTGFVVEHEEGLTGVKEGQSVYNAPDGWVITDYYVDVKERKGDVDYSVSLVAEEKKVIISEINEKMNELISLYRRVHDDDGVIKMKERKNLLHDAYDVITTPHKSLIMNWRVANGGKVSLNVRVKIASYLEMSDFREFVKQIKSEIKGSEVKK